MQPFKISTLLHTNSDADDDVGTSAVPPEARAILVFATSVATDPAGGFWTMALHRGQLPDSGMTRHSDALWVRKRPGGVFTRMIGVGRTRNNDIVLPFEDVSKFHAYFTGFDAETLQIADAGSKNGTKVNGRLLAPKTPCEVRSGDRISFGKLETRYYRRSDLAQLLRSAR